MALPERSGEAYYERNLLRRKLWPVCDRLGIPRFGCTPQLEDLRARLVDTHRSDLRFWSGRQGKTVGDVQRTVSTGQGALRTTS